MMTLEPLDRTSPQAQLAAEEVRSVVTARLAGRDLGTLIVNEDVVRLAGDPEAIAYLIVAYSAVVGLVLDAYASDLTQLTGQPVDKQDLWAFLAHKIVAEGHTI